MILKAFLVALTALIVGTTGGVASADPPAADGRIPGVADYQDNGYETMRYDAATHQYDIRADRGRRPVVRTHGDPTEFVPDPNVAYNPDAGHVALPTNTDFPVCETNSSAHRIVVVYAYPEGGTNNASLENFNIGQIVQRMNWVFVQESKRSSAPSPYTAAQMRVWCDAQGNILLSTVRSHTHGTDTDPKSPSNIRYSVEGHGVIGSTPAHTGILGANGGGTPSGGSSVKYLVFADVLAFNGIAGIGYSYSGASTDPGYFRKSASDTLGVGNYNRLYSSTAVIYKGGSQDIINYWYAHTTLHELAHVMGGTLSPQGQTQVNDWATNGAHCTDGNDSLCYNDGTPTPNGTTYSTTQCPNGTYDQPASVPYDCRYNTYFDTETESGEFLANHWNEGGTENPFLIQSQSTIDPPPLP